MLSARSNRANLRRNTGSGDFDVGVLIGQTQAAERQASAGAHDGVKGQRRTLAVRALKKLTCKLLILRTAYS